MQQDASRNSSEKSQTQPQKTRKKVIDEKKIEALKAEHRDLEEQLARSDAVFDLKGRTVLAKRYAEIE